MSARLPALIGEHGFAALIEPDQGEPVLFDTGQGLTLLHNARRMGRDLAAVSKVVISHGHYDHTGGLLPLLQEHGAKVIYGDERIFAPRHRVKDNGECYPIGMPFTRAELEANGATFELSADFREIAPGMFLTGSVPRLTPFEKGDQGLYCDCSGQEPDLTPDDQSLILETGKGLVVLLGCCHAGLVNTLEHIARLTGRRDVLCGHRRHPSRFLQPGATCKGASPRSENTASENLPFRTAPVLPHRQGFRGSCRESFSWPWWATRWKYEYVVRCS